MVFHANLLPRPFHPDPCGCLSTCGVCHFCYDMYCSDPKLLYASSQKLEVGMTWWANTVFFCCNTSK